MSQPSRTDPIARFTRLLERAVASGMSNPNAMVLSTVGEDGQPTSRAVLLKGHDASGFVFYTNLESQKADHIRANSAVSLLFYWRELDRQVRIEGGSSPVTEEEADAYFATRPRGAQIGAWASQQSHPLKNRAELLARVAKFEARFAGRRVERPPHWSGFRVVPDRIEFWTAGPLRLHKREVFERTADGWRSFQLYP